MQELLLFKIEPVFSVFIIKFLIYFCMLNFSFLYQFCTSLYFAKVFRENVVSRNFKMVIFVSIFKGSGGFWYVFSDHVLQARGRGSKGTPPALPRGQIGTP